MCTIKNHVPECLPSCSRHSCKAAAASIVEKNEFSDGGDLESVNLQRDAILNDLVSLISSFHLKTTSVHDYNRISNFQVMTEREYF